MEKQRKTFLSYSRVNTDFAIRLAKELKSEGFDIWLDQLDIPAGARWDREVEQALEDSEVFMIILTPASITSENVLDEIGFAIDGTKRILPVLLENCKVPFRLRRFQYVDFTNKNFDDGVESAKALLRSLIDQSTMPRMDAVAVRDAQADEERKAQARAEADRKAKEEADRLAVQKAEEERLAKQKAELAARAKAEKEESEAKAEADRKAKEETDRLAAQKAEADRLAKAEADRKAKEDREAKAEAERLAALKAEEERLTRQKVTEELAAKAAAEKQRQERVDREAREEADRLAAQKAEAEHKAKEKPVPVAINVEPAPAPLQKKPASKGLIYGIGAVGLLGILAIAGIAFSALSNGGDKNTPPAQAAMVEQVTEAPTVRPATATARPSATPSTVERLLLDSSEAIILIENDETTSIFSVASEQYSEAEWNSVLGSGEPIPVTLTDPRPIVVQTGWCATTKGILEDNLQYIKFTIKFDNKAIPESKLVERSYTTEDGWECLNNSIVIDNWESGEYNIRREIVITQALNDGEYDYDPETSIFQFVVTVE